MDKFGMITSEEAKVLNKNLSELIKLASKYLISMDEHICKNCKWLSPSITCNNPIVLNYCNNPNDLFFPEDDFGCNKWERK